MFLVDSAEAGTDWDGAIASITRILERANAEIVSIRKWDDRRLAYDIRRVSRGTYILCYFRADGGKIQDIEKAVQLSEKIMRVLVLNAEHMTAEDIEKDTPAVKAEKQEPGTAEVAAVAEQPGDQEEAPATEEADTAEQADEEVEDSQESQPRTVADD
jgi:small subunit ribosomal protein S6